MDVVARTADRLGECPLWDERERVLWWVDIVQPAVKCLSLQSGDIRILPLPEPVGSIALRARGGLLAAMKSGFYFLDPANGALERLARPEPLLPGQRLNDGRCDRAGRFWAGSMDGRTVAPTGSLFRLSPNGDCTAMRGEIAVPNSLAWSPDGGTMYFADSERDTIWAFDYHADAGVMANERVFAHTEAGVPDGSCIDADGCLWNAEYGGSRLVRYTPRGEIDRIIELPVANPTCCCFGGDALDTLYVTTAAQQMPAEQHAAESLAGSVLAIRPGVRGLPEARFAG